jgi:hypothetical protein
MEGPLKYRGEIQGTNTSLIECAIIMEKAASVIRTTGSNDLRVVNASHLYCTYCWPAKAKKHIPATGTKA